MGEEGLVGEVGVDREEGLVGVDRGSVDEFEGFR